MYAVDREKERGRKREREIERRGGRRGEKVEDLTENEIWTSRREE